MRILYITGLLVIMIACNSTQKSFTRGEKYFTQSKYDEALNELNQVIQSDSSNVMAFYYRGIIHYERENFRAASADFTHVLQQEGFSPQLSCDIHNKLYKIRLSQENTRQAVDHYTQFLKCNGGSDVEWMELAKLQHSIFQYTDAITSLNRAAALKGNTDAEFYIFRGSLQQRLENYDMALKDINMAIQLNSENPRPYLQRAFILERQECYEDAILDYDTAISLEGNDPGHYILRSMAKLRTYDTTGALQDLNLAVEQKIDFAQAYYFKGEIYYNQNNKEDACKNWRRAAILGMYNAVQEKLLYLCD